MSLRRALLIAALVLPAAAAPAAAQFGPAPQQQQMPPCAKHFASLRNAAAKRAKLIERAGKRKPKPTAKEACRLFNAFSAAEAKLVKYASDNQTWCGIPPQVVKNMKKAHARTLATRSHICRIAEAGPPRPRGPTLSEALGAPAPDANNIKQGGGTFDTLTGGALGSQ